MIILHFELWSAQMQLLSSLTNDCKCYSEGFGKHDLIAIGGVLVRKGLIVENNILILLYYSRVME